MKSSVYFTVAFKWGLRMTNSAVWAENHNFSFKEISEETEPSRGKKSSFGIFDAGAQTFLFILAPTGWGNHNR